MADAGRLSMAGPRAAAAAAHRGQRRTVTERQLPLHCPPPGDSLWDSHPRVFLPIEEAPGEQLRCPYCGTLYVLRRGGA